MVEQRSSNASLGGSIYQRLPKDWASIRSIHLLDDQGYANFLVEIGGEVRVKGDKDGLGWKIAVEKPIKGERAVEQVLSLKNVALATSGDYRKLSRN